MIQDNGKSKQDKVTPIEVFIGLSDINGNKKLYKQLDTSKDGPGGLNYWALGESCMMAYSE